MTASKSWLLTFIDWYTPAFKAGGPIRSVSNMASLLASEFEVFVYTGNKDIDGTKVNKAESEWHEGLFGEKIRYNAIPKLNIIKQFISKYPEAHFHINGIYSLRFSILPLFYLKLLGLGKKTTISPRGMLGNGALKIKPLKKKIFLFIAKSLGLYKNIMWHATSAEEKSNILQKIGKDTAVTLVQNIPSKATQEIYKLEKEKGKLKMTSISRVVPIKKFEVIIESLLLYPLNDTSIEWTIYGPIEDAEYKDILLEKATKIPYLNLQFLGPIDPDSIPDIIRKNHLFCLPSSNENYGHAIVESFANACPVLISDKTPWLNLKANNAGMDIPLANKEGFSNAILYFASLSLEEWQTWQKGAHEFALKMQNNDILKEAYIKLFTK
jgi:glycosyltransferase involved in cell wall biosynthesis